LDGIFYPLANLPENISAEMEFHQMDSCSTTSNVDSSFVSCDRLATVLTTADADSSVTVASGLESI
jgi:hypothetical protein